MRRYFIHVLFLCDALNGMCSLDRTTVEGGKSLQSIRVSPDKLVRLHLAASTLHDLRDSKSL
jgi:hypothetical protein